jgi:hypothetical protein
MERPRGILVNDESVVQRHFDERLRSLGFDPHEKASCVWTKATGAHSDLVVEIEVEPAFRRIHVCLRRRAVLEVRFLLAEAAGLPWYEYQDDDDLDRVMAQARVHFEVWGIDWLEGRPVDSPALGSIAEQLQQLQHERLVDEGRGAFKAGRYDEAIRKLTEASGLLPLDDVSAKMLGIASRKRARG